MKEELKIHLGFLSFSFLPGHEDVEEPEVHEVHLMLLTSLHHLGDVFPTKVKSAQDGLYHGHNSL